MKAVILLALFCALALSNVTATFNKRQHDTHKDISRVQARPLSDEERKAAYEAALPKNRKSTGKKQFDVDPDDVDHGPRSTKHKEGRAVVRNEWELEPSFWYNKAKNELDEAVRRQVRNKKVAKNVIVFIGNGMNMPTVTSGRILKGHLNGKLGAEEDLNFDLFPHSGLSKTYSVDHQTPDSAATTTAIHTGVKTKSGVLGMTAAVTPGQCANSTGNEIKSVLEESHENGKAVGIVTTAYLSHATPASTYAKSPNRYWYCDADLSDEAKENGCKDIAFQLYGALPDIQVAFGGGRAHFRPEDVVDEYDPNGAHYMRQDGQDLIAAWQNQMESMNKNAELVMNKQEFEAIDVDNVDNVWGMFNNGHMNYEVDKDDSEPTFSEMVEKAISILQKDEDGFFLMAEAGRIDHAHQSSNAYRALYEFIELDKAVGIASNMTSEDDTLIIVTGDHGHTFNFGGYAGRGNDIFGLAPYNDDPEIALDGKPYTSLLYGSGPGFQGEGTLEQAANGQSYSRQMLTPSITSDPDYQQQSAVPLDAEDHGGDDIPIYASGPMAHLFHKVHQQSYIGHVIRYASCIGGVTAHCERVAEEPASYAQYAQVETRADAEMDPPAPIATETVNFLGSTLDKNSAEGALWAMFILELLMTLFIVVTLGVYTCKN